MSRIVKDPEERKNELIDVAEKFFAEKGYDDTSVEDIISTVGIAKGTFYYHFKSKEDLMQALIDRHVSKIGEASQAIVEDTTLNAWQKMEKLMRYMSSYRVEKDVFMSFLNHKDNYAVRQKFFSKVNQYAVPLGTKILEQGIRENLFDIQYPGETMELLTILVENLYEYDRATDSREEHYRKTRALETAIERLFGVKKGSISLV